MKNIKQNKRLLKELAGQFEQELNTKLPVAVQPNGDIVYKDYFIRKSKQGKYNIYNLYNGEKIAEFFLKTCALMAAKAYYKVKLQQFQEIKYLDSTYHANHAAVEIYKNLLKKAQEQERYLILLDKLEVSAAKEQRFKDQISRMFKWSFV